MRIFGLDIRKAAPVSASPVSDNRGWWPVIQEAFSGAWQKNVTVNAESVFAHHAFFACMTLIASDFAKNRVKLVQLDGDGIWNEVTNPAYSPVLRKPNRFQTRIQWLESWALSKLSRGNTYVLKQRDNRNVVVALYVLDPCRVRPMVAPDGSVYYELRTDNLAGITGDLGRRAGQRDHPRPLQLPVPPARRAVAGLRRRPGGHPGPEDPEPQRQLLREGRDAERHADRAGPDRPGGGGPAEVRLDRRNTPDRKMPASCSCSATA
jgi:hypothetical protein